MGCVGLGCTSLCKQAPGKRCLEASQRKRHRPVCTPATPSSTWDVTVFPWWLKLSVIAYRFSLDSVNTEMFGNGWGHGRVMLERLWCLLGVQGRARRDTWAPVPSSQSSECWGKKWAQTTSQEGSPERCFGAAWCLAVVGTLLFPLPLCPPDELVVLLKDRNPSSWTYWNCLCLLWVYNLHKQCLPSSTKEWYLKIW